MEYELYNNYEDKLNVLRTQNRLIDELQLSSRIPKLHIRDAATEEKEKVGILTEMWNSYSSPLFFPQSGRDLLGTHLMWKTNLMRRLKTISGLKKNVSFTSIKISEQERPSERICNKKLIYLVDFNFKTF